MKMNLNGVRQSLRPSWLAAALSAVFALTGAQAQAQSASDFLICIDPGHGGTDPGAVGCSLNEDEVNLDTALGLRTKLQGAGFRVVMTRDSDTGVELLARSAYANAQGADRFVSIHSNAGGGTGIETYCHSDATTSSPSYDLADKIQDEMVSAWPIRDRGVKQADYSVLRETDMSATLTELAFIDSPSCADAAYLGSASHRQAAATAHLNAIVRHLGVTPGGGDPGDGTGIARGVIYQDKGVGAADMSIKLEGATVTVVESGASAATDANGNWSFTLNPGTYTIKATKAGFQENERSCTVTTDGTAWCSIGLLPSTSNGFAKGSVFEEKGSGTGDMSTRLPGATVTVLETGASVVAGENGNWSFELPAGSYTIKASMAGYQDNQRSCAVTAAGTGWCSIGLSPATASDGTAAGIVFKNLGDGSKAPLAGARLTVLETSAGATADDSGYFSFQLAAGSYTIKATLENHQENQVTCTVTAGQTATCDIGLTPLTGTAYGVVFVDKGNGNTETRLSGATVTVVETEASATAGLSGDWQFVLPAGTYTLRATTAGFQDAERTCEVAVGRTVDCSIGMKAATEEPQPDAGHAETDAGTTEETDAGTVIPVEPAEPVPPDSGCGCASGGAEPAGFFVLALAAAALLRRGRAGAGALSLGLVMLVGNAACSDAQASGQATGAAQAQRTESFFAVGAPKTLAEGRWMAPVIAPQGDAVVFTSFGYEGLQLIPSGGGTIRQLTAERRAGYAPVWSRDGLRVAFRHEGQPFHELPAFAIDRHGGPVASFELHRAVWVLQRNDTVVLREGKVERVIAAGDDRYFAPFLSADGKYVVYSGLRTGVWAYRRHDGARVGFGRAHHPALSEDGRYLVFTRTKDDGEKVTAGQLFVADLADPGFRTAPVALGEGEIALHPSLSARAGLLVYSTADGRIRSVSLKFAR